MSVRTEPVSRAPEAGDDTASSVVLLAEVTSDPLDAAAARARVADRGLREGLLLSLMSGQQKRRRRRRRGGPRPAHSPVAAKAVS